jgi:hypothetical protein
MRSRQEVTADIIAVRAALRSAYKFKSGGAGGVNKTNQDITALRRELAALERELAALDGGVVFPRLVYGRVER